MTFNFASFMLGLFIGFGISFLICWIYVDLPELKLFRREVKDNEK